MRLGIVMDIYGYIEQNLDDIINYINSELPDMHSYIANRVISEIRSYLSPLPYHYKWQKDSYRRNSGKLVRDGIISLNQTVGNFLEEEYTDASSATIVGGSWLHTMTYMDKLNDFVLDLGLELRLALTMRYIENNTGLVLGNYDADMISECITDYGEFDEEIDIDFEDCADIMRLVQIYDVLLGDFVC